MNDVRLQLVNSLVEKLPSLTRGQLEWMERVANVFSIGHSFSLVQTDFFDETALQNFGDALRVHHCFSNEPFSKDKFEYVLVKVLSMSGQNASLAARGNPGHDAQVNDQRLSLKTQADKNISRNTIWISKFMELGSGQWADNPADLVGLRNQFLAHLGNYDRIFSLRALSKAPDWEYELVEIPKDILLLAEHGELSMMNASRQNPKPGYCYVRGPVGETIFNLYFDGGGERKLQLKNLLKARCRVHAAWEFTIQPE